MKFQLIEMNSKNYSLNKEMFKDVFKVKINYENSQNHFLLEKNFANDSLIVEDSGMINYIYKKNMSIVDEPSLNWNYLGSGNKYFAWLHSFLNECENVIKNNHCSEQDEACEIYCYCRTGYVFFSKKVALNDNTKKLQDLVIKVIPRLQNYPLWIKDDTLRQDVIESPVLVASVYFDESLNRTYDYLCNIKNVHVGDQVNVIFNDVEKTATVANLYRYKNQNELPNDFDSYKEILSLSNEKTIILGSMFYEKASENEKLLIDEIEDYIKANKIPTLHHDEREFIGYDFENAKIRNDNYVVKITRDSNFKLVVLIEEGARKPSVYYLNNDSLKYIERRISRAFKRKYSAQRGKAKRRISELARDIIG